MSNPNERPQGGERVLGRDEIIVSKTDRRGWLTYVNRTFMEISGYREAELLGKPHNVIRHSDMPRTIFKLLWDRISAGHEIFAYVKNRTKDGGFYWVLAHVTPTFDAEGGIVGYHSNRRAPDRPAIDEISVLYGELLWIEQGAGDRKEGLAAGEAALAAKLAALGLDYDRFSFMHLKPTGRAA